MTSKDKTTTANVVRMNTSKASKLVRAQPRPPQEFELLMRG